MCVEFELYNSAKIGMRSCAENDRLEISCTVLWTGMLRAHLCSSDMYDSTESGTCMATHFKYYVVIMMQKSDGKAIFTVMSYVDIVTTLMWTHWKKDVIRPTFVRNIL